MPPFTYIRVCVCTNYLNQCCVLCLKEKNDQKEKKREKRKVKSVFKNCREIPELCQSEIRLQTTRVFLRLVELSCH